ncbi:MAG: hypothetical protein NTW19_10080 [Planctomycetota bacterium]|nr:hypothetical protein [Planctomycetota bacterium]
MTGLAKTSMMLLTAALAAPATADLVVEPAETRHAESSAVQPEPTVEPGAGTMSFDAERPDDLRLHEPTMHESIAEVLTRADDEPLITRLVPEPASLAMAALGILMVALPRRTGSHTD